MEEQGKQEPYNFYDDLQPFDVKGAEKYAEGQKKAGDSLAHLIHSVFAQTPQGQELLTRWREIMEMTAVVEPGGCLGEAGAREGYNRFIRAIIRSIKQVEAEEK